MSSYGSKNLYSLLKKTAQAYPDRIAYKDKGGRGESYTYRQVLNIVDQIGSTLSSDKYSDLKYIGILSENSPQWSISYLSIAASGKTVLPIDANLKDSEIKYILEHSNLKFIFTTSKYTEIVKSVSPEIKIFHLDQSVKNHWLSLSSEKKIDLDNKASLDDTAVLIYTSGTTGDPKAVQLTHKNLISNLFNIQKVFNISSNDIFMSVLPLHHTFEATCGFLYPMSQGAMVVYARSLKSNEIVEDIKNNQATFLIGVPLLYEKMYQSIQRKINQAPSIRRLLFKTFFALSGLGWKFKLKPGKFLFKSMRTKAGMDSIHLMVSGGAALPESISRFFNYLGFDFCQGYGMTECSPVVSCNVPWAINFASVGPPITDVEVAIESPDLSGVGEIKVRGDSITLGYLNNPDATADLIRNGWLYTGDLGKLKNGHLYITGRKKNLIVSAAGKNIYPEQIEELLILSPYIVEAVVYGRKFEDRQGEEVRAVIVPDLEQFKADHNLDPDNPDMDKIKEIIGAEINNINNSMADFKRVKNYDIQIEELEKTSTKKIKRFLYK